MTDDWKNKLYYGDNLDRMRQFDDESVDLIYLDPPFNSKATYNVLFKEKNGTDSESQITAFEDTWHWNSDSERAYEELVTKCPIKKLSDLIQAFHSFLGTNDMMAYLTMMAIRLVEMHRVLKPTGSIYLHCDPTASHYLKLLMDAVFGADNFKNEISWRRSQTRSSISRIYKRSHDIILFYSMSDKYLLNMQYKPLSDRSLELYTKRDERGLFRHVPVVVSGRRNGETGKPWRGIDPNKSGKSGSHWITRPSKLDEYEKQGLIVWPQKVGGLPQLKYYLEDNKGVPVTDFWDDIDLIPSSSAEALGYPTQKPEALLERIIKASSNEGDIVSDPFCGCGTTVSVAEKLHRKWIGIDITHLAISLMKHRLESAYGEELSPYEIIGDPKDLNSARALADYDKYQFEWWALSLVGARPAQDKKKGADKGIDGIIYFFDDESGKAKKIVIQVKGGQHIGVAQTGYLAHVLEHEQAALGVFITLHEPTRPMKTDAAGAGFYEAPDGSQYPKLQIVTIEELLNGKTIDYPHYKLDVTHKKATRISKQKVEEQINIDLT